MAKVRLCQREPVESAIVAKNALRLAAHVRSSVVYDWLIRFHTDLIARHSAEQAVDDFTDQLRAYLQHASPSREGEVRVVGS